MKSTIHLLLLVLTSSVYAQFKPLVPSQIPDSLRKGADAVIQHNLTQVNILSASKMIVTRERWVTVFNNDGRSALNNYAFYDQGTRIKKLEAEVFDSFGESIKRYKTKDFRDVSAVDGGTLYSDSRVKYFEYVPQRYPFTVHFSYVEETENTAFIPRWYPFDEFGVSIVQSRFELQYPPGTGIRLRRSNLEEFGVVESKSDQWVTFELPATPALKYEYMGLSLNKISPSVWTALDNFQLEQVSGFAADWESFGLWNYQKLLQGRDALSPETKAEVSRLVAGATTKREKAKRIYEYVQEKTRYISVQLGIGGWMPISAEEVDRVKYGDCKGLTNYTMALLKSQGIESFYSLVWAGAQKRDLLTDFSCMQGNHVILNVPIEGEDVWLECTSQTLPFDYLGDFTDDRQVLVITPDGGKLKRTHQYLDGDNLTRTSVKLNINEEGHLNAEMDASYQGIQYDNFYSTKSLSSDEIDDWYKERWSNLTDLKIGEYLFNDEPDSVRFGEKLKMHSRNYAQLLGEELIFRMNPLNQRNFVPSRVRNRKTPFAISRGYTDEVEVELELPAGYDMTELPSPVLLMSKFGSYISRVTRTDEGKLKYSRIFQLKHGEYPPEEYNDYRQFRRKVAGADQARVAARKI